MRNGSGKKWYNCEGGRDESKSFICRICRSNHPLRKCKRFLGMNTIKRLEMVKKYGYCQNCLAHSHSQGRCFTRTACRYCHKDHHSLLHANARFHKNNTRRPPSRSLSPEPRLTENHCNPKQSTSSVTSKAKNNTSLSAILKQNTNTLLPTVTVYIEDASKSLKIRCLLDSGAKYSSISSTVVTKLRLTTLTLNDETICPTTLISTFDSTTKVDVILRVTNRISIHTPEKDLAKNMASKFHNIILADDLFHKSGPIDIILGVDIYSRVMNEGILSRSGLPTAQNTIFGWTIYGSFAM